MIWVVQGRDLMRQARTGTMQSPAKLSGVPCTNFSRRNKEKKIYFYLEKSSLGLNQQPFNRLRELSRGSRWQSERCVYIQLRERPLQRPWHLRFAGRLLLAFSQTDHIVSLEEGFFPNQN